MSNLAQGIREAARAEVQAEVAINMHKKGFTTEQVAIAINKNVEEVQAIIEKGEPALT